MLAGLLLSPYGFASLAGILWATFWGVFYVIGCNPALVSTVCAPVLLTLCHEILIFLPRSCCIPCSRDASRNLLCSPVDPYRTGSGSCLGNPWSLPSSLAGRGDAYWSIHRPMRARLDSRHPL